MFSPIFLKRVEKPYMSLKKSMSKYDVLVFLFINYVQYELLQSKKERYFVL